MSPSGRLCSALRDRLTGGCIELGEVIFGKVPGRQNREQITLFKSVGVAVQDAAAAALVLESARQRDVGLDIDL